MTLPRTFVTPEGSAYVLKDGYLYKDGQPLFQTSLEYSLQRLYEYLQPAASLATWADEVQIKIGW